MSDRIVIGDGVNIIFLIFTVPAATDVWLFVLEELFWLLVPEL
jgi:hypothetical protein